MKRASRKEFVVDLENQTVYIPSIDEEVSFGDVTLAYERVKSALVNSQKRIKGSAYYVAKEPVSQEFKDIYKLVETKEISITAAAKKINVSRQTFYRYIDKYHEELKESEDK